MQLRERIVAWEGWRRYGPAAGSGFAHVVVGTALISLIAATSAPLPVHPPAPSPNQIVVTLVAETPIPPPQAVRPPPPAPRPTAPPADRNAVALPSATPKAEKKPAAVTPTPVAPTPAAPNTTASNDPNSIYLGGAAPSLVLPDFGVKGKQPCDPTGVIPGDCGTKWGDKLASSKKMEKPTSKELQAMYPGIAPHCPWRVGCEGGEWRSSIGTRAVNRGPQSMGPAGVGGISDLVGRLGFNPDATDPAFGD